MGGEVCRKTCDAPRTDPRPAAQNPPCDQIGVAVVNGMASLRVKIVRDDDNGRPCWMRPRLADVLRQGIWAIRPPTGQHAGLPIHVVQAEQRDFSARSRRASRMSTAVPAAGDVDRPGAPRGQRQERQSCRPACSPRGADPPRKSRGIQEPQNTSDAQHIRAWSGCARPRAARCSSARTVARRRPQLH